MSDPPRIRRKDPARSAPIRDWSTMLRSPVAQAVAAAPSAEAAAGGLQVNNSTPGGVVSGAPVIDTPATAAASVSEEARIGIETAYRVIEEHLQEGRLAAQAQSGHDSGAGLGPFAAAGVSGVGIAADSIQEMVAQGIRFYTSLAPLWGSLVNSIANAAVVRDTATDGISAAPLAPAPMPRSATATSTAPVIIEIASTRMTRVTVNLAPHVGPSHLAIGGLQALEAEKPPLKEIALATEPVSNRTVVRIRVPESQPAGVYSGVIVDRDSGEPRGTITLRIDA